MFGSAGKMSVEASDVQTDEDCDELEGFSFSADFLEKKTSSRRSARKPPPSPKSPYLTSLNVNPRRAAVAAWRPPRASSGDTRGEAAGDGGSAHLTSLSNGHDLSPTLRSVCDITPELLKQTLSSRKHKPLHSASNGFTVGTGELRDKEDMYDEIIRLKKSLQAQKSDNHQMKAKLRRLEEDNAKREKQIEELLDPTKGSEYTRSFVDKKREGSVVLNGLKQRILKLEQQCREKENALSKLQSDLRTTNLEELKITVETYFEEVQRLRMLLEAAEKSSRAESKCSQRQQKALSSTVHRLSENLKQLQQENSALREELNTDSPAGGVKGYREWSKQRLLRRLLEVEKRLQDGRGHAQPARSGKRLDQEVQTTPSHGRGYSIATEAAVSVGTMTEKEGEEVADLRERLGQSEKETAELRESLMSKDDEVKQLRTEREQLETETERWKEEQSSEQDKERQLHLQEVEQLQERIRTLESAQVELSSLSAPTTAADPEDSPCRADPKEGAETDSGGGEREEDRHKEREKAAEIIQAKWREHRNRDTVMLQSTLRGHLLRESLLKDVLRDAQHKAVEAASRSNAASPVGAEQDVVALVTIQSAFRGHLARCSSTMGSSASSVPSPMGHSLPMPALRRPRSMPGRTGAASLREDKSNQGDEEDLWPASSSHSSRMTPPAAKAERHHSAEPAGGAAADSDDSDDIIVSPSRPLRSREVLIL